VNGLVYVWGIERNGRMGFHRYPWRYSEPTLLDQEWIRQNKVVRVEADEHASFFIAENKRIAFCGLNVRNRMGPPHEPLERRLFRFSLNPLRIGYEVLRWLTRPLQRRYAKRRPVKLREFFFNGADFEEVAFGPERVYAIDKWGLCFTLAPEKIYRDPIWHFPPGLPTSHAVRVGAGNGWAAIVSMHGCLYSIGRRSNCASGHAKWLRNVKSFTHVKGFSPEGKFGAVVDFFYGPDHVAVVTKRPPPPPINLDSEENMAPAESPPNSEGDKSSGEGEQQQQQQPQEEGQQSGQSTSEQGENKKASS